MKKAQSAMEYLMTYGWAILIVIIVAAALYALGIFNPATYTGRIPTGFNTLGAPSDWDVDINGDVDVILSNRLASQIAIETIKVTTTAGTTTWDTTNCTGTPNDDLLTIGPGGSIQPSSTVCPASTMAYVLNVGSQTAGTTYTVDVEIKYNAGGLDHTETGRVTGTVSA